MKRGRKAAAQALLVLAAALLLAVLTGCAGPVQPTPTPAPTLAPGEEWLLADRTAAEIDAIQYYLFSWETYTLRRGMEGFDEALDMLLALRGAPCEAPAAGLRVMTSLDFGLHVTLEYDGETLWGSLGRRWLDLSSLGRPDEELRSLFERYGEKYVPEARTEDHGDQSLDGKMKVSAEFPVYDYNTVQAAIEQRKRDYLATGDRTHEADASVVKLTLENVSEDDLAYDGDLSLEVRRDGAWYRVWRYNGFGFQAIYQWLEAGETKEYSLSLSCYDDPLMPGLYRIVVSYGASGRSIKLDRIAWAEFTISDGVTEIEPWDGKEQLMGRIRPEKVSSILCRLPLSECYTLREGDAGFDETRDFLFSLRGAPCELPEVLVSRSIEPNAGPAVTLGFDGEHVYGRLGTGPWLLLDGEGRLDQELTELFLQFGEKEAYTNTFPSENADKTVDDSVVLVLEKTSFDLDTLLSGMAAYRAAYRESGRPPVEWGREFSLSASLQNGLEERINYGHDTALEVLRDGEWRLILTRSGIGVTNLGYVLQPGEADDGLGISFLNYYEEALTPGRYRLCLDYKPGRDGNPTHVAYAEFELVGSLPEERETTRVFSRLLSENALFQSEDGGVWGLDHHEKQSEGMPERIAATRYGPVFLPETEDVGKTLKLRITGVHESTPDYAKQDRWWYLDYTWEKADKKPKTVSFSLQILLDGRWYTLPSGGLTPEWTPDQPDSLNLMKGRLYPEETEQITPGHYRLVLFRDWRGEIALDAEEFDLVETGDGYAVENIRKPESLFSESAFVPEKNIRRQDGSSWRLAEAGERYPWDRLTDILEALQE